MILEKVFLYWYLESWPFVDLLHQFYKHVVGSIFVQLSFCIGCEWAVPTQTMFTLHYDIYRFPFPLLSVFWMMTTFKSRTDTNSWCHGQRLIRCYGLKHMRTILMTHTRRSRSSKVVTKNKAKNQERESTLVGKSGNQTTCSKNLLC